MEGIYSTVEVGETLWLSSTCNASQKPNEDDASWGCRVEDLLEKSEVRLKIEQEYGLNPNIESNKQRIKQVSCKTACRRGHWS